MLLYLGGGQLVAALSLGSLWVAVNQHPLKFKLKKDIILLEVLSLTEESFTVSVKHLFVLCCLIFSRD